MELEQSAGLREGQIAEFIKDDEVEASQDSAGGLGQFLQWRCSAAEN